MGYIVKKFEQALLGGGGGLKRLGVVPMWAWGQGCPHVKMFEQVVPHNMGLFLWTDWQKRLKTLPYRNFVCNNIT